MPDTARSNLYRLAVGLQTAEGTPQTTTTYEHSLYGGGIAPVQDEREFAATSGTSDITPGFYIASAHGEGAPQVNAHPDGLGVWILGHTGTFATSDTVTGSGSNRIHTIKYSDTKAFLTVFNMRPGVGGGSANRWERYTDTFVPKLELAFQQGDELKVTPTLLSKSALFNVTAPTSPVDNLLTPAGPFLQMAGATFLSDIDTTPAATQVHNIISGVFTSEYLNTEWEFTDEVTPRYLDRGRLAIGVSADIKFENFELYSQTFFGAKTGTGLSLSTTLVNGALTMTFPIGPTADANRSLQIQMPYTQYKIEPPEVDPGGGPVIASISARVVRPLSGEPTTYVLKNSLATY